MPIKTKTTKDERIASKEFELLCAGMSGFSLGIVRRYIAQVKDDAFKAGEEFANAKRSAHF